MKHYAGTVKYTVEGWVDRNMDNVPQAFGAYLGSSVHQVRGKVGGRKGVCLNVLWTHGAELEPGPVYLLGAITFSFLLLFFFHCSCSALFL